MSLLFDLHVRPGPEDAVVMVVVLREIVSQYFATQSIERMHVTTAAAAMFLLR